MFTHEARVTSLSAAHEAKHEDTVAAHTRALAESTALAFSQRAVHQAVVASVVREHESHVEALTDEHESALEASIALAFSQHEDTVAAHTRALAVSTALNFSQRAIHQAVVATVVREHESRTEALTDRFSACINEKHLELTGRQLGVKTFRVRNGA